MTAVALEERSPFDRHRLSMDVAFDTAGRRQMNLVSANGSLHTTPDGDVLAQDVAVNKSFFTDDEAGAAHVAFDLSIDLHVATRGERPVHHEIRADDGGRRHSTGTLQ